MEAMKKLDAELAALFAAAEPLESLKQPQLDDNDLWPIADSKQEGGGHVTAALFDRVNALQLHMEALTLQPEGTQRMELLQSEMRPIFTVECQLSHELIKQVPRYDMFQIMQFESEKFQSLTQCTRFGQLAQRQVRLPKGKEQQMGHIDFTVWWREPGTCLNEMLGMGCLQLADLYRASLLEQCKCIGIQRRGVHLASVYLKISLRTDAKAAVEQRLLKSVPNGNGNVADEQLADKQDNNNSADAEGDAASNGFPAAGGNNKAPSPAQSNNNKPSLDIVNFMAETSKVRLLRGYIYVGATRQLAPADAAACVELCLQPFWQPQALLAQADAEGSFQLQEQFATCNDDKFLQCVERKQLLLELRPLGALVRLPLHQFYIAYRDASITNHLCKGKLPVISIDGWAPIVHAQTQKQLGELRCLLAIGSESQIAQLKLQRGLDNEATQSRTAGLLDMLQNALAAPPPPGVPAAPAAPVACPAQSSPFNFLLHIASATGLPLNPGHGKGAKKQGKRQVAAKRFAPNEPPNTYVTFQALSCNATTYKSHEGLVYATPIVERSITPQWRSKFQVSVSADYLSNPQKLFILKLWKKATLHASAAPTPLEDAIIGFAALNLSQQTLPSGWHNIVDFNGRITGGLEAHVLPLPLPPPQPGGHVDAAIDQFEQSLELTHLQLGQAIKRKFTELEQISQRLRTRLVDVTGESLAPQFDVSAALDNWQPADECDDDLVADFERALRTPSPTPATTDANETPTAPIPAPKE